MNGLSLELVMVSVFLAAVAVAFISAFRNRHDR